MGLCLRTVALVYTLELAYIGLLFVDHATDARHLRDVVRHMVREFRR